MSHFLVRRIAATRLPATVLLIAATALLLPAPASAGPSGVWPLTPRPAVLRGFEPPPKPWMPGHRGVDLLGSPGQQVRAAAAGRITYAGTLAGRGVVVVSHGATRTTYEPVLASVRAGATVAAGAAIGTLSAGGSHCPPQACLHWGLLRGETYLDPLSMLSAAPIRLLPLTGPTQTTVGASARGAEPRTTPTGGAPAMRAGPREDRSHDAGASAPQPGPEADGPAPAGSSPAGRAVVGVAALVTIATGLLIRRH